MERRATLKSIKYKLMDLLKVSCCYIKTIYEPHLTIYEPRIRNGVEPVATCNFKSSIVLFIYLFIYLFMY